MDKCVHSAGAYDMWLSREDIDTLCRSGGIRAVENEVARRVGMEIDDAIGVLGGDSVRAIVLRKAVARMEQGEMYDEALWRARLAFAELWRMSVMSGRLAQAQRIAGGCGQEATWRLLSAVGDDVSESEVVGVARATGEDIARVCALWRRGLRGDDLTARIEQERTAGGEYAEQSKVAVLRARAILARIQRRRVERRTLTVSDYVYEVRSQGLGSEEFYVAVSPVAPPMVWLRQHIADDYKIISGMLGGVNYDPLDVAAALESEAYNAAYGIGHAVYEVADAIFPWRWVHVTVELDSGTAKRVRKEVERRYSKDEGFGGVVTREISGYVRINPVTREIVQESEAEEDD